MVLLIILYFQKIVLCWLFSQSYGFLRNIVVSAVFSKILFSQSYGFLGNIVVSAVFSKILFSQNYYCAGCFLANMVLVVDCSKYYILKSTIT
jgi:hypothetical protein